MADNFFRINRGFSLNPQASAPSNPTNGDCYYDSTQGSFVYYDNGFWINLASQVDIISSTTLNSAEFTAPVVANSLVRVTGALASNLYGLTASTSGKQIILYNDATADATIYSNNVNEPTAANRFALAGNTSITWSAGSAVIAVYDGVQQRWLIASGSGSGGTSVGFAQEVALTINTTTVNVTFPSTLASAAYVVNAMMVNTTDVNPEFQSVVVTNKSPTGFTATWNFPLDTSNYKLDYVVPGVQSQIAEVNIGSGVTSISVTLPLALASTAYVVTAQIIDTVDGNPQFQPITITAKTTTGFTAKWNIPTDTANYKLDYNVAVYQ